MAPIWFYVPSPGLVATAPRTVDAYWGWVHAAVAASPAALPHSAGMCTWFGPYNWTIQTCLHLHAAGVACQLTDSLPAEGVIVAHSDFLPRHLAPDSRRYIVEIKPDRALHCLDANFAIVQNRHDPIRRRVPRALIPSAVVTYWPQPGLIPRRAERGNRFETICFMGNADQFIEGVETLEAELKKRGLCWRLMPRNRWHDYSEVDAIVAVRTPPAAAPAGRDPNAFLPVRKPASKLCNAWLAGVPAVLSPDIAFQDLRRSPLDYLEARTVPEILAQVDRLHHDLQLRRAMVDNAARRAPEYASGQVASEWTQILERQILPRFADWSRSAARRRWHSLSKVVRRAVLHDSRARWS